MVEIYKRGGEKKQIKIIDKSISYFENKKMEENDNENL